MKYFLAALPLVLLIVFVAVWKRLRQSYRQGLERNALDGAKEDLDQLLAMKSKLTEEKYSRLRQALVRKMTRQLPEERKDEPKEISLADLEAGWMKKKPGNPDGYAEK